MRFRLAALLLLLPLANLAIGPAQDAVPKSPAERIVFLAGEMPEEELISVTASIAASGQSGVVLLDTPRSAPHTKGFLAAYRPKNVVPVGSFPKGAADLERGLGMPVASRGDGTPGALVQSLFPQAERVVVCPKEPRGLLLQAACLAGAAWAPLVVLRGETGEAAGLRRQLGNTRGAGRRGSGRHLPRGSAGRARYGAGQ